MAHMGAMGMTGVRGEPGPEDVGTKSELMLTLETREWRDREFTEEDVNWQNNKGNTLLMVAILTHSLDYELLHVIKTTEGFDPNLQNEDGCTALILYLQMFSVIRGSCSMTVETLASIPGYKHDIQDNYGKCAYEYENNIHELVMRSKRSCMVKYFGYKDRNRAKLDKEFQDLKTEFAEYKMMVKQLWMAPGIPGAVMGNEWKALRKQSM